MTTRTLRTGIGGSAFWLTAAWSYAEEAAPEATGGSMMSLQQILHSGGMLIYVLGGVSVLALAFILYYLIILRQDAVAPRGLLLDLRDALRDGRDEEARRACERDRSPMAAIAAAGLTYLKDAERPNDALLKEIVEGEGGRQAAQLQSQTQYLMDIAVIAPMIGLLGTVLGMLQAFNAVALDLARARPMVLADGVSKALITTAAGLLVGIPAMAFYAYFRGRVAKLISQLESHSADLLTLLLNRKKP